MNRKPIIYLLVAIFGAIGSYIPTLWGGSAFGMASILLTAIGGFLGIYVGFKITE